MSDDHMSLTPTASHRTSSPKMATQDSISGMGFKYSVVEFCLNIFFHSCIEPNDKDLQQKPKNLQNF